MDNINLTFLWGWTFSIFKVLSNFSCLFLELLRFSEPLTPFSMFLRFLRLSGSASHPVLRKVWMPLMHTWGLTTSYVRDLSTIHVLHYPFTSITPFTVVTWVTRSNVPNLGMKSVMFNVWLVFIDPWHYVCRNLLDL